ncbi:MAG: hypothetical protein JKX84_06615 [Flavobacteriales bacterium]|nr:hypothetical protein [Flavobacteriales bacterium]
MRLKRDVLLIAMLLCYIPNSFGYLDPGSGSFIVQMIIAAVLGGFYAVKLYWIKIKNFFSGTTEDPDTDLDEELDNE